MFLSRSISECGGRGGGKRGGGQGKGKEEEREGKEGVRKRGSRVFVY